MMTKEIHIIQHFHLLNIPVTVIKVNQNHKSRLSSKKKKKKEKKRKQRGKIKENKRAGVIIKHKIKKAKTVSKRHGR